MMKKQFVTGLCAAMLAVALLAGCAAPAQAAVPNAAPADAPAAAQKDAAGTEITEDEAKRIALEHAGLTEADVDFVRVKLDIDDGRKEYEVEFYTKDKEYDYEIDALSGKILSCDYDAEHYDRGDAKHSSGTGTAAAITADEAKAAALKDAGLTEADVTNLYSKLDTDDGRSVYEIEFWQGEVEYDYDVDATTGEIVKSSREVKRAAQQQTGTELGEDAAKAAALKDAGLAESGVTHMKVKRDSDDGRIVYEVSFRVGSTKYDYDVDAFSGEILKCEIDKR